MDGIRFLTSNRQGNPSVLVAINFAIKGSRLTGSGVASDSCINENRISTRWYVPSLRLEGFMGEPREILTRSPLLGGVDQWRIFPSSSRLRALFTRALTSSACELKNKTRENWNLRDRQFLRRTKGNEIVSEKQNIVEIKIYENYLNGMKIIRMVRSIVVVHVFSIFNFV